MKGKLSTKKQLLVPGIIAVAIFLIVLVFSYAGYWLKSSHKPESSDAIIILAGSYERSFYAADLYLKKYAPQVYISRPVREHGLKLLDDFGVFMPRVEDIYRQVLLKKGVPDFSIHFLEGNAVSTVDEAITIRNKYIDQNVNLLIITSPFHIRRAELIFKREFSGSGIKFIVLGTPYESFTEKWWNDQDSARNVILETTKIIFFLTGGRFYSGASKR